jgi:hypothetical protein
MLINSRHNKDSKDSRFLQKCQAKIKEKYFEQQF